jgi:hypothetical protein
LAVIVDATLAGGDADHVLDLRQGALGEAGTAQLVAKPRLLLVAEHVEPDVDRRDAVQLRDALRDGLLEVVTNRAAGRGQRDDDLDAPVLLDLDRADHAEVHYRAPQLGVDDLAQPLGDLLVGGLRHPV